MKFSIFFCFLLGAARVLAEPLTHETVVSPLDSHLSWVRFSGKSDEAARLNAWVTTRWGNDRGCSEPARAPAGDVLYERTLSVSRITSLLVVFADGGDSSCPTAARPSSWNEQVIVERATGKSIDLWAVLPAPSQARLRTLVSENGRRTRTDEECAQLYSLDRLPLALTLTLGKKAVEVEPAFGHAMRACVESVSVPIDEFKREFANQGRVRQLLVDW